METVITISGADKAGSLAGLVVFLTRKGYTVKGQKVTELPSGARLLKIRLGLAQVDKEKLAAEIKALNYTGMYAVKMTPAAEPAATGISLPPATLGQSLFIVSAVVLVVLLAFSAWRSQRSVMADL
jgi:hypothetical protein